MKSDRRFQVWEYQMSHGMLLVRSSRSPEQATNIDLLFVGVEYMDLPSSMDGLELDAPTTIELSHLAARTGKPIAAPAVTMLVTGGGRFTVVGTTITVSENDWDIFASPIEFRSQHRE